MSSQIAAYVDIVFDGPPSHEAPRFVEVESPAGTSIRFGEWVQRPDGYWVIRFTQKDAAPDLYDTLEAAEEELRLLRMKDTAAVYNPMLRTQIALALAKARGETP